jgi:hypothetical protein
MRNKMLDFLRKLWNRFKRNTDSGGQPVETHPQAITVEIPVVNPPTVSQLPAIDQQKEPVGAYMHLNRRLFKRYRGMHISWETFQEWNDKIAKKTGNFYRK